MKNRAVFLDRDGTLNFDPGYLGDPDKVKLFPGVSKGLSRLKKNNFLLIVISNQSGVTRGLITEEDVKAVNIRINEILKADNISIDAFYYCPYHPEFDPPDKCECRKPSPQMVLQAAEDFQIDLSKSYFIGDTQSDIECGINAGVKTILVKYNKSNSKINSLHKGRKSPNFVAVNFNSASDYILKDYEGEH